MGPIRNIRDVAEKHLCTGCGVCAYLEPQGIRMVDDLGQGRRPVVQDGAGQGDALAACPGKAMGLPPFDGSKGYLKELWRGWGPILELWEGYATEGEVRLAGSSGGAATALSIFALDQKRSSGVLHTVARGDVPYLNETTLSQTREQLMAASGSRYAPASPCDGLQKIEDSPGKCVFIGKPCDGAALKQAEGLRPALSSKIDVSIAIFCAGAPSTQGTLEMAKQLGVPEPNNIESVRYRGNGWPGMAVVRGKDPAGQTVSGELTYADSWGRILQKFRPWRCYSCADHTGEFADISVGDPWYRDIPEGEPGRSLILVRTERGRDFLRAAMEANAVTLEKAAAHVLPDSQLNLLHTRGAVWGRNWACRLLGVAAPKYTGMGTGKTWLQDLTFKQRAQAFYGTFKRVFTKKLYKRRPVAPFDGEGCN